MKITVGTSSVSIPLSGRGKPVIQNLGPGIVYFDSEPSVTVNSGLRLDVGSAYEFLGNGAEEAGLSVVSDGTSDVRVITMGV